MTHAALSVDLAGLRLLVERRGKSFALMELCQNAWDENGVTEVRISAESVARGTVKVRIADDAPEGFHDLSHAYTLFAPSKKKADPTKRGRFNIGEKLVIALADQFVVRTTTGTVTIDVLKNQRTVGRTKRAAGSEIEALLRMTKPELEEALQAFRTLIPPPNITTYINGELLATRTPLATFTATLATEQADAEGFLRPSKRLTTVEVHETLPCETATLYELGIPVVATSDTYHVNVLAKVPLNADRDNVPPAFLRDVRTHVLNTMASKLTGDEATEGWVNEALEDELVSKEAVVAVLDKRFGEKRAVFDPSDQEANRIAVSQGYTLIPGRAFSGDAWGHIKGFGAALPAGQVTPSAKPFHPDGSPLEAIPPERYTQAQATFARKVIPRLHRDLLARDINVQLVDDAGWSFNGTYGSGLIRINMAFIEPDIANAETLRLVLHEFAHHFGGHLTHPFDDGIARMAAKLIGKLLDNPKYLEDLAK